VHGRVVRGPGPDPRSGATSGSQFPVPGDPVVAKDARGTVVASTVTASDGSFALSLLPGTYTVLEEIESINQRVVVPDTFDITLVLK